MTQTTLRSRPSSHARLDDALFPPEAWEPDTASHSTGRLDGLVNEWMRDSVCLDEDPEIFFPPGPSAQAHIDAALAVCRRCPVQAECLGVALADSSLLGVWGGTTERERVELRRSGAVRRRA